MSSKQSIAILYSTGGLGDVGRHAIRAALDFGPQQSIIVLTQHEETLKESNWNCGCPEPHEFSQADLNRIDIVHVNDWSADEVGPHLENVSAVVSCLGNRQPYHGDRVGTEGTKALLKALREGSYENGAKMRIVAISSVGINEDWPPVEWSWVGKILKYLFLTICRREYKDLKGVEDALRSGDAQKIDFLIVRPVGLGEDIVPVNQWFLQQQKHKDTLGFNMAKLDAARFMIQEALQPSLHYQAVVVGSAPTEPNES